MAVESSPQVRCSAIITVIQFERHDDVMVIDDFDDDGVSTVPIRYKCDPVIDGREGYTLIYQQKLSHLPAEACCFDMISSNPLTN